MVTNNYSDMTELIKEYNDMPTGSYLNQSIVVNGVTLSCDVYKLDKDSTVTSAVFSGCKGNDARTQIVIGKNMTVASGTTVTPPYRCKGIIFGDPGTFTNNGTISMSSRGASATGQNIQLTSSYKIAATGGSGGNGNSGKTGSGSVTGIFGGNGSTPSALSCAGGGGGNGYHNPNDAYGGPGGTGTSYSGGAGGGANGSYWKQYGNAGSSTGGAGGSYRGSWGGGGGAGNPGGTGGAGGSNGSTGTGGLCVIIAKTLDQKGSLQSTGTRGGNGSSSDKSCPPGGGSGGGCIVLISESLTVTGSTNLAGGGGGTGANGTAGAGGTGKYAAYQVAELDLENPPTDIPIIFTNCTDAQLDNVDVNNGQLLMSNTTPRLFYDFNDLRVEVGGHWETYNG